MWGELVAACRLTNTHSALIKWGGSEGRENLSILLHTQQVNGQCYLFSNTTTLHAAVSGLKSLPSRCGSSLRVCKQVQMCIKETWNISALEYKRQLNPTYNPFPQSRCRSATKYYYYQFVCWCFSSIISSLTIIMSENSVCWPTVQNRKISSSQTVKCGIFGWLNKYQNG